MAFKASKAVKARSRESQQDRREFTTLNKRELRKSHFEVIRSRSHSVIRRVGSNIYLSKTMYAWGLLSV